MISGFIKKIIYCLPPNQTIFVPEFIKNDQCIAFHEGLPDREQIENSQDSIIILDDLMTSIDEEVLNLFIRNSHHLKISVVLLVHNIFYGGNKFFRTISLNSQIIILMKNPRDKRQISTLSSQLFPENAGFLREAYIDATKEPFSYLLIDITQQCHEKLRVRANIFPDEKPRNIIYLPLTSK